MNIPAELKYTKDHEWVRVEGNIAIVGITDFAQSELGDIVYVEVETEGEELGKEEIFGSVEAVKTVSDLYLPVSGKIVEFNTLISFEIISKLIFLINNIIYNRLEKNFTISTILNRYFLIGPP